MNRIFILLLLIASAGYGAWAFFVASRYQSLCQLSYWSATDAQLRACDEMQTELPGR